MELAALGPEGARASGDVDELVLVEGPAQAPVGQVLPRVLRRIHGDTRHRGKAPVRGGAAGAALRQVQRLHDELQRAVEREDFERAAQLRDEVRQLEAEVGAAVPGNPS